MYFDADTTLPFTSNIPGVTVRPWPPSRSPRFISGRPSSVRRTRYVTIGRLLTISWPTYRFIPPGTNRFCCKVGLLPHFPHSTMGVAKGCSVDRSLVPLFHRNLFSATPPWKLARSTWKFRKLSHPLAGFDGPLLNGCNKILAIYYCFYFFSCVIAVVIVFY